MRRNCDLVSIEHTSMNSLRSAKVIATCLFPLDSIAKMICLREDWMKNETIPKALLAGLAQAVKFVKKYLSKIRPKHYDYQNYELHNISKNKFKSSVLAGDGNEY